MAQSTMALPYTKEYCEMKRAENFAARAILREEFNQNLQIIKDKVKGKIRSSQKRNKEIRDEIHTLIVLADRWNNRGVW